jgi:hypothetical protein
MRMYYNPLYLGMEKMNNNTKSDRAMREEKYILDIEDCI